MRWRGRRQSTNISDVRGQGGGGFQLPGGMGFPGGGGIRIPVGTGRGGGGMGCGTLVVFGIVLWFLGINPLVLLNGGGLGGGLDPSMTQNFPTPRAGGGSGQRTAPSNDEMTQFVRTILASTEDVWSSVLKSYGKRYTAPQTVLFSGSYPSACGQASAATGPFYCPGDKKVYIDLAFYRTLANQFGAKGDFAQAYVLAHEVGHHVQDIIGVLPQFNRMRQSMGKLEANHMSVRVELQADCFAGVWGHYVSQQGWLEQGDVEEAMNAASKIGDDSLQKQTQGYVVPDAFTHGTSAQRQRWFGLGFKSGRIESCDTFNTASL